MKLWKGIFLLLVLHGPAVLQSQHEESNERLRCYTCYVTTSWEDCDKSATIHTCPEDDDEVCVTMKLRKWDENDNNTIITQYTKHCAAAEYCSDNECEKYGYDCTVDCCNKDLCNTSNSILANLSTSTLANIVLLAIISCLQAIIC
ncbi:hypothetical protein ACROYT_G039093 [Oculina patagonica]